MHHACWGCCLLLLFSPQLYFYFDLASDCMYVCMYVCTPTAVCLSTSIIITSFVFMAAHMLRPACALPAYFHTYFHTYSSKFYFHTSPHCTSKNHSTLLPPGTRKLAVTPLLLSVWVSDLCVRFLSSHTFLTYCSHLWHLTSTPAGHLVYDKLVKNRVL